MSDMAAMNGGAGCALYNSRQYHSPFSFCTQRCGMVTVSTYTHIPPLIKKMSLNNEYSVFQFSYTIWFESTNSCLKFGPDYLVQHPLPQEPQTNDDNKTQCIPFGTFLLTLDKSNCMKGGCPLLT